MVDTEYLIRCQALCTECNSETCIFNPKGICMAPFLTGKAPSINDEGCTDFCQKPMDGCEPIRSYSQYELKSYEEDVLEHIDQFSDDDIMDSYGVNRETLRSLAPRAAVLMRKYIDNDDGWTYHRDAAILKAASEYLEEEKNDE